ncbi:MAG: hypothetical protein RIC35_17365 [Marinoscillum sp.]
MTIEDIIEILGDHSLWVVGYFVMVILLTIGITLILKPSNVKYLQYAVTFVVYAVAVPGTLAFILFVYSVLIMGTSLLEVNLTVYFLPLVSLIICLWLLNRKIFMKDIPGFGRLSGLFIMIALVFLVIFILQRTHFGIVFLGNMIQLLVGFIVLLIAFRFAWSKIRK